MEYDITLAIEESNTKLIQIINDSIMFGYTKLYAKELVNDLIEKTVEKLKDLKADDDLIESTTIALKQRFMREWLQVITILSKLEKIEPLGVIGRTIQRMKSNVPLEMSGNNGITIDIIDNDKVGVSKAQINNIRDFITDTRLGGTSKFIDYRTALQESLIEVKDNLANGSLSYLDSMGRTKSVRNMAEINARYKMISNDLQRQGINLNDFVIASSHADASERCSWWQGKIFLMDVDINSRPMGQYKGGKPIQTILGYIDGKPYYSLLEACNNGFLSFNCQHRLIKYYKGASPIRYDMIEVKKARNLSITQRQMENTIRKWKRRETLSSSKVMVNKTDPFNPSKGVQTMSELEYNEIMSKWWQEKYANFSKANNIPEYRWRTRITDYERN